MSLALSFFALLIFWSCDGVSIEARFIASAILLAGGLAGLGKD